MLFQVVTDEQKGGERIQVSNFEDWAPKELALENMIIRPACGDSAIGSEHDDEPMIIAREVSRSGRIVDTTCFSPGWAD